MLKSVESSIKSDLHAESGSSKDAEEVDVNKILLTFKLWNDMDKPVEPTYAIS